MHRSRPAAFLILPLLAGAASAQEDAPIEPGPWKYSAIAGLNLAQSAYSNNWNGGDKGAITWVLSADVGAERQMSRTFHWDNVLILKYGESADQVQDPNDPGKNKWDKSEKSTDQIQLDSTGRFTLDWGVDPYLALRGESQFVDDSDPRGSLLFHPIKLAESAGIARVFLKEEDRQVVSRLGLAVRQTWARHFTDPLGDHQESFTSHDGGLEFKTNVTYPLADGRVIYKGELYLLWSFFYDKSEDLQTFDQLAQQADPTREPVQDFWKDPDINFQNDFTAKITSWLNVNLFAQLVYDKFDTSTNIDTTFDPANPLGSAAAIAEVDAGIRKSGQFKQTLGVGLSYTFL
jgi:hypothetical protein